MRQILCLYLCLLTLLLAPQRAIAFPFNMGAMVKAVSDFINFYGSSSTDVTITNAANGPTNPYDANPTRTKLTASLSVAGTSLTVTSSAGFANADDILIIQMEGSDAGKMEFATVNGAPPDGTHINIQASGAINAYNSANTIQVIKVAQFRNVTINSGGFLSVGAYNSGTGTGGVLVMKVSNTLQVDSNGGSGLPGHISVGGGHSAFAARGFAGGASNAAGSGPGGGTAGTNNGGRSTTPGTAERLVMGSGGASTTASAGGIGAGIILIKANSFVLNGSLRADGDTGAGGNAGGGAGGTIAIYADTISATSCGNISASSGAAAGGGGTSGDGGRIFMYYGTSTACTTASPASNVTIQKLHLK